MTRLQVAVGAVVMSSVVGCTCFVPVEEGGFAFPEDDAGVVLRDAGSDAGAVEIVVATGTDWLATGTEPPSGWTTLGFNAQWPAAQINSPASATLSYPGIWDSNTLTTGSPQVWYRRVFSLPGDVESAVLDLVCNDDMTVYVNGVQVLADHDGISTGAHLDVTAALEPGPNLIAATCRDMIPPEHAFHARLTALIR